MDNNRILVKGKGDKERKWPICDATHDALQLYFQSRGINKTRDYHAGIFITAAGKVVSRGGLRKLMERIGIRSVVPNCHPLDLEKDHEKASPVKRWGL